MFGALPFRAFPFGALLLRHESLSLGLLRRKPIAFCLFRRRDARTFEPLGVRDSSLLFSFGFRDARLLRQVGCLSCLRFGASSYGSPERRPDTSSGGPARTDCLCDGGKPRSA